MMSAWICSQTAFPPEMKSDFSGSSVISGAHGISSRVIF
jgi:hypothetical protein